MFGCRKNADQAKQKVVQTVKDYRLYALLKNYIVFCLAISGNGSKAEP